MQDLERFIAFQSSAQATNSCSLAEQGNIYDNNNTEIFTP